MKKAYFVLFVLCAICASMVSASIIVQPTMKPYYWVHFIKHSGLEKVLLYNYEFNITDTSLIIDADVNTTVYDFLRNSRINWATYTPQEKFARCNIVREYLLDDYPNFDCLNSDHTDMLLSRLVTIIDNGWEILHRDNLQQYIELNKTHIQLTIPNIKENDRIQIGNFTTIVEITLSNAGVFNNTFYNASDFIQLNLTLALNGTYTGIVQNFTSIPQSEGDTINVTTSTTLPVGTNINVQLRTKTLNITDDLLAYYDFDGDDLGTSTCTDIWGDNDGVINSDSIGVVSDGFDAQGYEDDGVEGASGGCEVAINNFDSITKGYAIAYRYKPGTNSDSSSRIFSQNNFQMYIGAVTFTFVTSQGSFYAVDNSINFNEWNTIIWNYNFSHVCSYNNGEKKCGVEVTNMTSVSGKFMFGSYFGGAHNYYNGSLDDFLIWNRTLSDAEIDCIEDGTCLTNWSSYSDPCDVSINTTGCLYDRTGNFTQSKFTFLTNDVLLTPLLTNYTYTIQNAAASDSCTPPAINNDWVITDVCTKTDEAITLGTGDLNLSTGGALHLIDTNFTFDRLNVVEATIRMLLNITYSSSVYTFNQTGS